MLDGLFKPKFYTKCKSLVKITKTRVDTVKRKKNSVCKYLKNDIVDLLKNSLDYNAYGRAEGLIEEKRRLSCYESLEQFCICVASNVSLLQKSSKCPEECREAISSLVYAAARVSEVPELRDLRSLFSERYGTSLEQYVNLQFVERFKAEPASKEMKIELLKEIARDYSIKWDDKPLEKRLYTPPAKANEENRGRKEECLEKESMGRRSESVCGEEEEKERKAFYYRSIIDNNKPKIEKQESLPLPDKSNTISQASSDTESPTAAGKPKPRSVRRRMANPPPPDESMEKASGEGGRRMSRRTSSWQPKGSNIPDFDEVAARVDALTRF